MAQNTNVGGRTAQQDREARQAAQKRKKKAAQARSAARVASGEAPKAPVGRSGIGRQAAAAHQQRDLRKRVAAEAIESDPELCKLRDTIDELSELLPGVTDQARRQQINERLRQLNSQREEVEELIRTFGVKSNVNQPFASSVQSVRGTTGRTGCLVRQALFAARQCVDA